MSWKATAFVKEITSGITVAEKMVMFVLADYHNTTQKVAWPSVPVLAREALMTQRTVYRILESLEGKKLRRIVTPGKPNSYQFIGLDTPDIKSLLAFSTPDTTPDKFDTAIRKEEPVLEPVKSNPPNPPSHSCARFEKPLTVRQIRHLNAEIFECMRTKDPISPRVDFETAVTTACARLLISTGAAWKIINDAGIDAPGRPLVRSRG